MCLPVFAFHTCTVSSVLAEAMRLPSGDQATPFTLFVWPRYVKRVVPGFGFDCSPSLCVGAALAPTGSIKNAETAPMHPRTSTRTKASTDWREADHRPL